MLAQMNRWEWKAAGFDVRMGRWRTRRPSASLGLLLTTNETRHDLGSHHENMAVFSIVFKVNLEKELQKGKYHHVAERHGQEDIWVVKDESNTVDPNRCVEKGS